MESWKNRYNLFYTLNMLNHVLNVEVVTRSFMFNISLSKSLEIYFDAFIFLSGDRKDSKHALFNWNTSDEIKDEP